MKSIDLAGRTAIVTGAGAGLGRSHALLLAERGAAIVVNDIGVAPDGRGGSSTAEVVAAEINARGGTAVSNSDSVVTPAGARSMVEQALSEFGGLDIVVANAGIVRDNPYDEYAEADFNALLDVHLKGSFWVTQAAYRVMKERQYGRIIFTSSGSGLYGQPQAPGYGAAKAGILGLMNSLAVEGAEHNVLANAISPIAYTRLTAEAFGPGIKHAARPELVSALVAYLAWQECTLTHRAIEVGAGFFARVFIGRAKGIALDPAGAIEPETVAERIDEILDTDEFDIPDDVIASLTDVLGSPFEFGAAKIDER